jgi:hypothetical protein
MSKGNTFELINVRYRLSRQALSAVRQAWGQVSYILDEPLHSEKRAVDTALAALQDALFDAERDEVRAAMEAAMEADE